jgi:hypothetical protein
MATNNNYSVLDGIAPSWADITCKIQATGAPLFTADQISAMSGARKVEIGNQQGASGGRVMKRTTGAVTHEASITFYRDGYDLFLEMLAQVAATLPGLQRGNELLVSLVHFDVQILHTPPLSSKIYERRWYGARMIGDTLAHKEGTEADTIEVPISVAKIADMSKGKEIVLL